MLEHTLTKAEDLARSVNKTQVVSFLGLKNPLIWALGFLLFIGAFAVIGGTFLKAGVVRLSPPWETVKYPTRTQVDLLTPNLVLREGSESLIEAKISGALPETAEIILKTGEGKSRTRELPITGGNCVYEISSAYRDFEYRILAGDDRSEWRKVKVIPSPKITKAEVKVEYPAYTLKEPETLDALTLSLPEGTKVNWTVYLDRAVSSVQVVEGNNKPRELKINSDGTQVFMELIAKSSTSYKFQWVEKANGFTFLSPNNYLQVQPDQPPQVEIMQPTKNMIATLGRKLNLAYRARDDHGIGEARVCYRVNKIAEKKHNIPVPTPEQKSEVVIDWDYRETIKNLEIGDTITFVFEMADRYPGKDGPHLVRSQNRKLTILSETDYISQMAKKRNRLLRKIRNIYREEREVHILIGQLDLESENFVQSCQLEVVRQELIRERLLEVKGQMAELEADLRANGFTEEKYTATLMHLQTELGRIANEYVANVSDELRTLTSVNQPGDAALMPAIDAVNFAAREMALMVLSLGFREATEIMAREIDTIAADQARLRMYTILLNSAAIIKKEDLQPRQQELSTWLERLLSEIPKDKESKSDEAIVAFKLSRLSKDLKKASTLENMVGASKSIGGGDGVKAAALQAEVIKSLLKAEFRLRSGLEYSSLVKAEKVLKGQVRKHQELVDGISSLTAQEFSQQKASFDQSQKRVARDLSLLLLPEIPGGSYALFDIAPPAKPDVAGLLKNLEKAIADSSSAISKGDQKNALTQLKSAGKGFQNLADLVRVRMNQIKESDIIAALGGQSRSRMKKITDLEERLLGILEKTEDAEADETDASYLIPQLEILAKDAIFLAGQIKNQADEMGNDQSALPLMQALTQVAGTLKASAESLKKKEILDSIDQQSSILDTFESLVEYLTEVGEVIGFYGSTRSAADVASAPGPLLSEIIGEQNDLVKAAESMKEDQLPELAIPQKNLIHAVNAILSSLDPLSHQIETGSVLLFAKEDMNSASEALEDKDIDEAVDAGSFVAESMGEILEQIRFYSPQYVYVRELTGFLFEELGSIQKSHYQLQQMVWAIDNREDDSKIEGYAEEVEKITLALKEDAKMMTRLRGKPQLADLPDLLSSAQKLLKAKEGDDALDDLEAAVENLESLLTQGILLQELLSIMLGPPLSPVVPPQVIAVKDFLALATEQNEILGDSVKPEKFNVEELGQRQEKLAGLIEKFIKRYGSLETQYLAAQKGVLAKTYSRKSRTPRPPLEEAWAEKEKFHKAFFASGVKILSSILKSMGEAQKSLDKKNSKDAQSHLVAAKDQCRAFLIDNTLKFMVPPGPPAPADPAPSFDISEDDALLMEAAGMVRGRALKGGRLEWEVLGRRDRAALNENFARELPLEYRGLLKDYYERLAQ